MWCRRENELNVVQKGECVFGTFRVPVLGENKILWSIFVMF